MVHSLIELKIYDGSRQIEFKFHINMYLVFLLRVRQE
jgi:hypothetical protein